MMYCMVYLQCRYCVHPTKRSEMMMGDITQVVQQKSPEELHVQLITK